MERYDAMGSDRMVILAISGNMSIYGHYKCLTLCK